MTTPGLEQIEADIEHLSLAEQLWLMERLAHRIRTCTLRTPPVQESDLVAMAHAPAIQRELAQINAEFAATEADRFRSGPMTIQRGEIYFVDLNPAQRREQAGQRPVLVLCMP